MPTTTTIFQASDLSRRGRAVLDTARDGLARIRDTDGESLIVAREEAYEAMRQQLLVFRELADAMASYITLDRAIDHEHRRPALAEFGSWTWVRHLPADDTAEFVRDISEALYASCRELSAIPLAEVVEAWRASAEALSDPLSRETLLGQSSADDYVEAARPEAKADAPVASNA
jgi:hypothetical protein